MPARKQSCDPVYVVGIFLCVSCSQHASAFKICVSVWMVESEAEIVMWTPTSFR